MSPPGLYPHPFSQRRRRLWEEGVDEVRAGSRGGRDSSDPRQQALLVSKWTCPLKVVPILLASQGQRKSLPEHEGPCTLPDGERERLSKRNQGLIFLSTLESRGLQLDSFRVRQVKMNSEQINVCSTSSTKELRGMGPTRGPVVTTPCCPVEMQT